MIHAWIRIDLDTENILAIQVQYLVKSLNSL